MSRLLTIYADVVQGSIRFPERLGRKPMPPGEAERRAREAALLRALTASEATALLRDRRLPDRLSELAAAVELPEEHCRAVLAHAVWNLTAGLRPKAPEPPGTGA